MITYRIREIAYEQALRSTYRFRVGAVVYDGYCILGTGYNKPNKTHPRAKPPYFTIHAELAAILEASHKYSPEALKGASIYVYRIRRDGIPGLAKPCDWCQGLLQQVGIKEVYWSK